MSNIINKIKAGSRLKWVLFFAFTDQLLKEYLINHLQKLPGMFMKISSFFDIVYSWNYGISFGLLQSYREYGSNLLIVLNSGIVIYLGYLALKQVSSLKFICYNLIIGGAVGNILDRIYRGAVFDYVYLHYNEFGFAVFNLADSYITLGAALLLLDLYLAQKNLETQAKKI